MSDGEIATPPMLEAEFVRNPKARKGWSNLPASHKRAHLWGIYYYMNPDSQAKRLKKAIEEILMYAEKPDQLRSDLHRKTDRLSHARWDV